MALASGTKLGPYEILAPLGADGTGEVYRARDSSWKKRATNQLPFSAWMRSAGAAKLEANKAQRSCGYSFTVALLRNAIGK
jgi:hypothetical protein